MVVRILMVKKIEVQKFDSKEIDKENKKILEILKKDDNSYFIDAKNIVKKVLKRKEYLNKNREEVLRSLEFCQKIKEEAKREIETVKK